MRFISCLAFSHQALECRLKAGYNDVKVRRGSRTRRLSDGEAGSLGRAGVKCRSLKNRSFPFQSFASSFFHSSFISTQLPIFPTCSISLVLLSFIIAPLISPLVLSFHCFHFIASLLLWLLSPPYFPSLNFLLTRRFAQLTLFTFSDLLFFSPIHWLLCSPSFHCFFAFSYLFYLLPFFIFPFSHSFHTSPFLAFFSITLPSFLTLFLSFYFFLLSFHNFPFSILFFAFLYFLLLLSPPG